MPAWDDYKAEATARGSLAFELFVVHTTPATDPDTMKSILPDHLAYQGQQEALGKLFLAGPMSDETGTQMQGVGMIIYRAASLDEARSLAENDPMHKSGARTFELRKWLVNEGAIDMSLRLSAQSARFS